MFEFGVQFKKKRMSGRRKDPVWSNFEAVTSDRQSKRAKCKKCNFEMAALVARMKKHVNKCKRKRVEDEDIDLVDDGECSDGDSMATATTSTESLSTSTLVAKGKFCQSILLVDLIQCCKFYS